MPPKNWMCLLQLLLYAIVKVKQMKSHFDESFDNIYDNNSFSLTLSFKQRICTKNIWPGSKDMGFKF